MKLIAPLLTDNKSARLWIVTYY